jgi:hypothetical protein
MDVDERLPTKYPTLYVVMVFPFATSASGESNSPYTCPIAGRKNRGQVRES